MVDPTGYQPGDENLPEGTQALLAAVSKDYNDARATGDTSKMAMAHHVAETARGWAGYCSYNGVTMTPGERDSIISSSSSNSHNSGGGYYSGHSSGDGSNFNREAWNNEFASADKSQSGFEWNGYGYYPHTVNPFNPKDVYNANKQAFIDSCKDPVTVPALIQTGKAVLVAHVVVAGSYYSAVGYFYAAEAGMGGVYATNTAIDVFTFAAVSPPPSTPIGAALYAVNELGR